MSLPAASLDSRSDYNNNKSNINEKSSDQRGFEDSALLLQGDLAARDSSGTPAAMWQQPPVLEGPQCRRRKENQ